MGADKVTDRKHSIRKKYSLEPEQEIHNGWCTQDVECSEHKQIFMDVELINQCTVGNLSTYSRSITDSKTREWLKSLTFSYKKIKDISEIEKVGN